MLLLNITQYVKGLRRTLIGQIGTVKPRTFVRMFQPVCLSVGQPAAHATSWGARMETTS